MNILKEDYSDLIRKFGRSPLRTAALLMLVVAGLTFSACGSGGEDSSATSTAASKAEAKAQARQAFLKEHPGTAKYGSPPLEFEADPSGKLAFTKKVVTAKEGNVVIEFHNPQSIPHNVAIERLGGGGTDKTDTVTDGSTANHTITLYANEKYVFFCTIHRKQGMEGILKVSPK